ncbi:MAG: MarR family transcriptional regulator [Bacillota bacterium]|nr:MarR family transcriptional regulator [Bacillota bacterium]
MSNIETVTKNTNKLVGNIVHALDKKINNVHNENLKKFEITLQQTLILAHIHNASEDIYQKDIETSLGLTNPTVTTAIKGLINKDLVYRIQSKKDGRYYSLHLTPKSLSFINDAIDTIVETDKSLLNQLSKNEKEDLMELLNKLI